MAFSREQAYQALAELKPAPVFLQSYQVQRLPENLDIYFGPPEEFFLAPDTQEPYTRGRLVPILDDGNFGIVTFCDPDERTLVQIDVETPGEVRHEFRVWQQYLADLMLIVGESVDDDDRVRRMAEIVGFRHVDELFDFYASVEDVAHDEYDAARRQFVAGILA